MAGDRLLEIPTKSAAAHPWAVMIALTGSRPAVGALAGVFGVTHLVDRLIVLPGVAALWLLHVRVTRLLLLCLWHAPAYSRWRPTING